MAQQRLSDAIDMYLDGNRVNGAAKGTIKAQKLHLLHFLTSVGNIYVGNITEAHVQDFLRTKVDIWEASTLNLSRAQLSGFFKFCRQRGWLRPHYDPLYSTRRRKQMRKVRMRIPVTEFPRALDLAGESHPRNRMIVALGLFLFCRASEIATLRLGDVRLDESILRVTVHKSKLVDEMPIVEHLDQELRRWLTTYTEMVGPLHDDYYLIPRLRPAFGVYDTRARHLVNPPDRLKTAGLLPTLPLAHPEKPVQQMLAAGGWPIKREGCHTLRRSGARAFFDELCEINFGRALETVSSMLHHEDMSTTQIYLGLTETEVRRNDLLKGKAMFRALSADNVIRLPQPEAVAAGGSR
jgi:integrase